MENRLTKRFLGFYGPEEKGVYLFIKILAWSKLKAFAVDKFTVAKMMISVFDRIENVVGKGENASYQHFLLFT